MNEQVTNEFALAASMCNILAPMCPRKCPFYGKDECPVDPGDRDQFKALGAAVFEARTQRDTAWQELREIREARDKLQKIVDEKKILKRIDNLYESLSAIEDIATAVEADIDCGRPLEYNVEHLRDELIRARAALGILPEQDQQKEASHVD